MPLVKELGMKKTIGIKLNHMFVKGRMQNLVMGFAQNVQRNCIQILILIKRNRQIAQPLHSPDGEKRGGADAIRLVGPLVMQVVRC